MCGRFTLRVPASAVAEQFALLEEPALAPRFNVAPSQPVAVVRQPPRQLALLRWGLIPRWAKDPAIGNRMINARAETAAQKPAFRAAFARRRCLVVADGFYEWYSDGKRRRPYFFHMRDGRPFGFAGLWETWEPPGQAPIESCTILTTEANDLVRPIHDRMPVIVAPAGYDRWLDAAIQEPRPLVDLLHPYPAEAMAAYKVSPLVNRPAVDDPRCIEPVGE